MKNKKIFALILALMMLLGVISGCGGNNNQPESTEPPKTTESKTENVDREYKALCLLNGNLGDNSFFDSANHGMSMIADELGVETKVVELGFDATTWEPALVDASEQGDWDLIIVGTYQMQEVLQIIAPQYPDQHYLIFDSEVAEDNVYSITYKQNDGSYLAGILAAGMAEKNDSDLVGFVGGIDIPVINDFLVGYIQGVQENYPEAKVITANVGDFADAARAKELTMTQYNLGAGVVYQAAAQAGIGVLDAAKEAGKYAIGSDADQSAVFKDTDPDKAALIISSMMKNVDASLLRAVTMDLEGEVPYGQTEALGIVDGAVGLAKNEVYNTTIPQDIKDKIEQAELAIREGDIVVKTAFDMSTEDLNVLKNSVAP